MILPSERRFSTIILNGDSASSSLEISTANLLTTNDNILVVGCAILLLGHRIGQNEIGLLRRRRMEISLRLRRGLRGGAPDVSDR